MLQKDAETSVEKRSRFRESGEEPKKKVSKIWRLPDVDAAAYGRKPEFDQYFELSSYLRKCQSSERVSW
jgi:hypothetical protein